MFKKPILPPTYLLIAIVLMLILFFVFPGATIIPSPWNFTGLIPLGLGLWINIIADKSFHQAKTTVKPLEEPSVLVTNGVFSVSRNPMYLGFMAILIGIALLLRSITPFLIVVIFLIVIDRKFIQIEEKNLDKKFGEAWRDYKNKVNRWI